MKISMDFVPVGLVSTHYLNDTLNKNQIALLLLIDFSKAFDMVDHKNLLQKLGRYGIRGKALLWLTSYLSNREQYVSINGKDSTRAKIKHGVPQGSILGPLLFIIYINDIPNISKVAKFILYADDANIIITGESMTDIKNNLSVLSQNLVAWVNFNGLALNLKKTKYMIFSRKRNLENIEVIMSNTKIEQKSEARFLGVIVDEKLNWAKHISALKSKMTKYLGIMYKLKFIIPLKARLLIYQSFVQSHLNFCSSVWGFAAKSNIDQLLTVQKKAVRTVMPGYVQYYYDEGKLPAHTKPAFKKYNLLTAHSIIAKNAILLMTKTTNFPSTQPKSINQLFPENAPHFNYSCEVSSTWLETYNTLCYRNSIFFKGPMLYADYKTLNTELLPYGQTLYSHKSRIKKFLLEYQSEGDPDEWHFSNNILVNISGPRKSVRNMNKE